MVEDKMKLVITNPEEDGFLRHIDWNLEEIKAAVSELMQEYTGLVYTDDSMKQAKEDRAKLNKFKKAIEDRRKEIKKKCMEPYEAFEKEVKEVVALIEEPAGLIDKQIKEFEIQQKEEKRQRLRKVYEECIGNLADTLPFERFFEERYLNQTVKEKTAADEIQAKIGKAETDLQTIERTVTDRYQINAKDVYFRTLDLSEALSEAVRLEEMERKLREEQERRDAERKRREAEAQAAQEARRAAEEERQARLEQERKRIVDFPKPVEHEDEVPWGPQGEQEDTQKPETAVHTEPEKASPAEEVKQAAPAQRVVRAKFYAVGTMDQLRALTVFMKENGIKYGKVD